MAVRELLGAVERGDEATVGAMLASGKAPVDARDAGGDTALAVAALNGHLGVSMLLLQHGADANAASREGGDTVLMWAATTGNVDIVKREC